MCSAPVQFALVRVKIKKYNNVSLNDNILRISTKNKKKLELFEQLLTRKPTRLNKICYGQPPSRSTIGIRFSLEKLLAYRSKIKVKKKKHSSHKLRPIRSKSKNASTYGFLETKKKNK